MAAITVLKCKIHRANVTKADLHYEGSITIDRDLMDKANLRAYEQVDVLNINNGARFTTYVIEGARGKGDIGINGAAARLAQEGDKVIICAYVAIPDTDDYTPDIVLIGETNTEIVQQAAS